MGKLWNLKQWLPLEQGAAHLSQLLDGEPVAEVDLLQLALEAQLQLSVVFPDGALAQACSVVDPDSLTYKEVPSLDGRSTIRIPEGGRFFYDPIGRPLQVNGDIVELYDDRNYDLVMIGGERGDVSRALWARSGAEAQETTDLDGTFVRTGRTHQEDYFCLVEEFKDSAGRKSYFPMGSLPRSAVLVVKPHSLHRLAESLDQGAHDGAPMTGPWPWGAHSTKLLTHLAAAGQRFWVDNYDPTDRTTAPTNEAVSGWLQHQGVSQRLAEAMATILRADGLPTGPRTS